MNFKTTLVLLILVAVGGVFWCLSAAAPSLLKWGAQPAAGGNADSSSTLRDEMTADKLTRIQVQYGERSLILERASPSGEWTLPGRWPARKAEVDELVRLIGGLNSRFAALPLDETHDLKTYGLDQPAVTVTVTAGFSNCRLAFGEEPGTSNRFSRPTYVRLDDRPEVVRLAPGIIATLTRPPDYYQQRRLFPSERVAKDTDSQEKIERLAAKEIAVKAKEGTYTLERTDDDWILREPVRDHADPDKLRTLLTAVPDIWAEQFVDKPKSDPAEYGLTEPEQTVRVTGPSGAVTLLIGKQSQVKTRTVTRPAPNFGGPPMPPQRETIHDEYRYAKLQDNDQIFEIKAEKLKELFVAADTLRDPRLARFRAEEVTRLEVSQNGQDILLAKEKDKWRLHKPAEVDAEKSTVTELLDKLSLLQAREKDVLDKADPKAHGLDKPTATVKVTAEEEIKDESGAKTKKTKVFTLALGKHDTEKSKLFVQVAGWDRINAVEDSALKLIQRPALAYRSRQMLDFTASDLAKIEVLRGSESYTLEHNKDSWRLTAPAQADLDSSKVGNLVSDLGRLEAVDHVSEESKPEELEKQYGLEKPAVTAKLTFTDEKRPAQTLLVGKQRADKQEYFARLASGSTVFVVRKQIRDGLDQDSLAFRPQQIWTLGPDEIAEVRIQKEEPEYHLKRDGSSWKITGPFEAAAMADLARPLTEELSNLRSERYVAHVAKDLATYGLDKPYLRLAVQEVEKDKPKDEKEKPADKPVPKPRELLVGKQTEKDAKTRFAKLGDGEAVFVVSEKLVTAIDHGPLDWLDRNLLSIDSTKIDRLRLKSDSGAITLERQQDNWRVTESPAPPFVADGEAVGKVLAACSGLTAIRYAAYGAKVDLPAFGLDTPATTLALTLRPQGDNKSAKPVEHTIVLGKPAESASSGRYARVDNGAGVVVLGPTAVTELTRGYLDFVNRKIWQFDAKTVASVGRRSGTESLELTKEQTGWQLVKPAARRADDTTLDELVAALATLRAKRVAAYPAKDLKPFGLDAPTAVLTLRSAEPEEYALKIGKIADESNGDRYAMADSSTVVVLPGTLSRQVLAPELHFRDRTLARLGDVDRITLERGPRKATFVQTDGTWGMKEPALAPVELTELQDFVKELAALRADDLVAEKPADLKTYGLDRPEVRWHVQSGEKELLDLQIGGREKIKEDNKETEGPRCYAKIGTGDVVFLLSPPLTTKVLAEYRQRTVWPPLDAVQIDRLSYGSASKSFVLEKVENTWRAADKPELPVNADMIRETLDALAGLKAARYVADKGAELKLYGLEPPQLILEIATRSGKRTLHVGRPEGESKRYYARVFAGSDAPVFIIAETDAGRILRTLADFSKDAAKVSAVR